MALAACLLAAPVWGQEAEPPAPEGPPAATTEEAAAPEAEEPRAEEPSGEEPGEEAPRERWRFHGEVRLRGEYLSNYTDFNDNGGFYEPSIPILIEDDEYGFLDYRVRLAVEAEITRKLMGQVELQVADAAGTDRAERDVLWANDDPVEVYTAYIHWNQIGSSRWSARAGRQELPMGNQLLFGNLPYYNGISFDAVRFHWSGAVRFDAWWAKTNETFARDADTDIATVAIGGEARRGDDWSVYLHYLRDDAVSGTGRESLWVGGARWTRTEGGGSHCLWNLEMAVQSGTIGNPLQGNTGVTGDDESILAGVAEASFGYRWERGANDHRFFAHAYYATGDRDESDDEHNDFQPLFQDFHRRNGRADIVQGTNLLSAGLAYHGSYGQRHAAGVDLLAFVIDRPETAPTMLARAPGRFVDGFSIPRTGNINQPGLDQSADDLGQEIDVWYDFYFSKYLGIEFLAAVFFPGDAIAQFNGFDDPAVRLAAQIRLRF